MWDSLIAVAGTLGGGVLASLGQQWAARAERRENRRDARRADALSAVTGLAAALADHRRAMWEFEDARIRDEPKQTVLELQTVQHGTRSAINEPMVRVAILAPRLAGAAREAAAATYAMRKAPNLEVLEARRAVALAATDQLVDAAAGFFADLGVAVS